MTSDGSRRSDNTYRRNIIRTFGVGAVAGLAGCTTDSNSDGNGGQETESNGGSTGNGSSDSGENIIKIGYVTPLSGPSRVYGLPHEACSQIAVNEINEQGGIDVDGTSYQIEFLSRDGEGDPTVAQNAATQLISDENVDIFIAGNIPTSVSAYIDQVQESETFIMFDGNEATDLHFMDYEYKVSPYAVQYSPNYPLLSRMYPMGTHVINYFGHEDIAFITPNNSFGDQAEGYLVEAVENAGGSVVSQVRVENGTEDFTNELTTLSSANPDAIIAIIFPFDFFSFLDQAHQRGLKQETDIITTQVPTEETARNQVGEEVASGFYGYGLTTRTMELAVENDALAPEPVERLQDLASKFNDQYGDRTFTYVGSMGYEGMYLLKYAIETANSYENDALVEVFSNMTYDDISDFTTQYYVPPEGSVDGNERSGNIFDQDMQAYHENTVQEWVDGRKEFVELLRVGDYW